jgi:hypothetical protein
MHVRLGFRQSDVMQWLSLETAAAVHPVVPLQLHLFTWYDA